jgi:hypothetical protein
VNAFLELSNTQDSLILFRIDLFSSFKKSSHKAFQFLLDNKNDLQFHVALGYFSLNSDIINFFFDSTSFLSDTNRELF